MIPAPVNISETKAIDPERIARKEVDCYIVAASMRVRV